MFALLDLLLPLACAGCGRPGRLACAWCLAHLAAPARLALPTPCPPGCPTVVAVAPYGGPARAMLLAHKERGRLGLTRPLGAALARAAAALDAGVLVPVPSSRAARRARGHDHAARLAMVAGTALGVPVVAALRQVRPVSDAAGLDARERAANLAGALAVRSRALDAVGARRVVLVDDIVTTGATLTEAARALAAAGHPPAGAAVVAATARRTPVTRR